MSNESDWKKFQSLIAKVLERYLAKQNAMLLKKLTDPKRNERFSGHVQREVSGFLGRNATIFSGRVSI